ncbi:MAG: STAS domain-containing protein [Anaerolineae bacterium]|jgi:SulP family sulfate permease
MATIETDHARGTLSADLLAGLTAAIPSIPDAMASGVLAGVSPLSDEQVTMLMPLGSLFFAGAAEFEEDLPSAGEARRAVVVLRLRGRKEVGSTFLRVIDRYAKTLQKNGGKLMLVGGSQPVYDQLRRTGMLAELGEENVYLATRLLGKSALQAWREEKAWLGEV